MFIIYWKDQSCFGPFDTMQEAISWTEKTYKNTWENLKQHFRCWYVEPPDLGEKQL
jgi:hypothetical protein